jgi:hypothetical protein
VPDQRNPYAPPKSPVSDQDDRPDRDSREVFIPNGRRVPPGRGAGWVGDAWRLFRARPWKWLLAALLILGISVVGVRIPLGGIITALLFPFINAGIATAADRQRRTGDFEIDALFEGVRDQPRSLLVVGCTGLLAAVAMFVPMAILVGADVAMHSVLNTRSIDPALFTNPNYLLAMLFYLALALPVTAAIYLAPALIMMHRLTAGAAMGMSLVASIKNFFAGIVFSLCMMGLFVGVIFTLGLGLLIFVPIMLISTYAVYRDVFIERKA